MNKTDFWFRLARFYVRIGMFFYTKNVKVVGKENIPKKGAVLFAVNHPNGLIDPLIVTTNNVRTSYFLVKAAAFKKRIIEKILNALNLIAIYRMRDGIDQLARNEEVFNKCFEILRRKKSLMIFPEGSDCVDRKIRPLSKGFTRIVYGAIEKYPEVKIHVVPVGLTYQHVTSFPNKVALHYGTPINANEILEGNNVNKAINILKKEVTQQLEQLTVHIPSELDYDKTLAKLNNAQVDFTNVKEVQDMIAKNKFPEKKSAPINYAKPLLFIIKVNGLIPYLIWKYFSNKNQDKDFTDTLRYAYNIFLFPFFYLIQAIILSFFVISVVAISYFFASIFLALIYVKLAATPAK